MGKDHCIVKQVFKEFDVSEELKVTTSTGWNLDKATICAQNKLQHIGIYAGDAKSYTAFPTVFDNVIKRYHNVDVHTNKAIPEDYLPKEPPQLPLEAKDAVVSTRIRCARNLKGFPFTDNMTKEQRLQIELILSKVFEGFTDERLKGRYYSMATMTEKEKNDLIEKRYLYRDDDDTLLMVGTYDDWPAGRGIFINDRRDEFGIFIVWVGEEDQMRIMAMNKGSDVIEIWNLFYAGLEAVHRGVQKQGHDFAFMESHGYLSTGPSNLGTGMRASVHINLPNFLTKQSVKNFVATKKMAVDIRGTHGESKSTDGVTIYDVSNKERLGSDCFQQIEAMCGGVATLLEENKFRQQKKNRTMNSWKLMFGAALLIAGGAYYFRNRNKD